MKTSMKRIAVKTRQGLGLLGLLALLALAGAGVGHTHSTSAPNGRWLAPSIPIPPPSIAGSNGDIHIGG